MMMIRTLREKKMILVPEMLVILESYDETAVQPRFNFLIIQLVFTSSIKFHEVVVTLIFALEFQDVKVQATSENKRTGIIFSLFLIICTLINLKLK
jgi:hypothetical protein